MHCEVDELGRQDVDLTAEGVPVQRADSTKFADLYTGVSRSRPRPSDVAVRASNFTFVSMTARPSE